jgi:hypothetical protein
MPTFVVRYLRRYGKVGLDSTCAVYYKANAVMYLQYALADLEDIGWNKCRAPRRIGMFNSYSFGHVR